MTWVSVSTNEPFQKLFNQGMILAYAYEDKAGSKVASDLVEQREDKFFHVETGEELKQIVAKMSKTLKNVVNPDDVVRDHGADSMRLYEMFMGPLEATKPWNTQGVEGVHRFLQKAWRLFINEETGDFNEAVQDVEPDEETLRVLHQTIKKVGSDIESFSFNTAISQMMIFVNHMTKQQVRSKAVLEPFVLVLASFAPHLAEELWQRLGHDNTLAYEPFPAFDESLMQEKEIELAVQIRGKIKDKIVVPADATEQQIQDKALASDKVQAALDGQTPKKIIVIKSRLVNIVI